MGRDEILIARYFLFLARAYALLNKMLAKVGNMFDGLRFSEKAGFCVEIVGDDFKIWVNLIKKYASFDNLVL